jgi:hypothetical protein
VNYIAGVVIFLLAVAVNEELRSTNHRVIRAWFPPPAAGLDAGPVAPDYVRLRWAGACLVGALATAIIARRLGVSTAGIVVWGISWFVVAIIVFLRGRVGDRPIPGLDRPMGVPMAIILGGGVGLALFAYVMDAT